MSEHQSINYTCPMHPEVVSQQAGNCPKCGMKLVPKEGKTSGSMEHSIHNSHSHSSASNEQ